MGKPWNCIGQSSKGPEKWLKDWNISHTGKCHGNCLFNLDEAFRRGDLINAYWYLMEGVTKMGPDSSGVQYQEKKQWTQPKIWKISFKPSKKKNKNYCKCCTERLSLHLWRYWQLSWMWSSIICFSWPCFEPVCWTRWSPEVPTFQYLLLWFVYFVNKRKKWWHN